MEGGRAIAGVASAGAMESLQPVLEQFVKNHPDMREEAAVLIGGAVGKLAGDTNAGEVAAWNSTKFNWLPHEDAEYYNEKIKNAKSEKEREYYQNKMNVQDIAADRMIKEYVKKHPESADALTESFTANEEQINKIWGLPYDVQRKIEEDSKIQADQIIGKTYEEYIGTKSSFANTVTMFGTTQLANAPWSILSKTYKDSNITGWGDWIGRLGIVGEGASVEFSWAKDQKKYSDIDLYNAMLFDAAGFTGDIIISGLGSSGGLMTKIVSIGAGGFFKYEINLLKEENTKTDQEKRYDKKVEKFLEEDIK